MGAPYRADHVGSFLRPAELLEARQVGTDPERLRQIEDRHIRRVLAKQQELGFQVFTDGELRRRNFMSDLIDAVEGFDTGDEVARAWKAGAAAVAPSRVTGIVMSKIRPLRRMTAHEVAFLKTHSPGAIKVTLPSANQFPAIAFKRGITDRVYPDHSALLWDIVPVIKAEIQALLADGIPYIQIDAPRYSYYIDPKWREYIKTEMGMEPDQALDEAIRADNTCLEGARGRGAVIAFHLCRGNNRSQWYAEGGTTPSPTRSSPPCRWTASSSSTTTSVPERWSPCASSPRGRPLSWDSSAASDRSWRPNAT